MSRTLPLCRNGRLLMSAVSIDAPIADSRDQPPELLETPHLARRRLDLAALGPGHLGDVAVPARIGDEAVRGDELAGRFARALSAETADALALAVEHRDPRPDVRRLRRDRVARPQLAHVDVIAVAPVGEEAAGPVQVVPLPLVVARAGEDLDPVVLPGGPADEAVGRGLVDARVAVAVRDVEIAALRADGHVGGAVERLAALERARIVGVADGEEQRSLRRELPDGVVGVVGEPHHAAGA